jgi:hypothetical protein
LACRGCEEHYFVRKGFHIHCNQVNALQDEQSGGKVDEQKWKMQLQLSQGVIYPFYRNVHLPQWQVAGTSGFYFFT